MFNKIHTALNGIHEVEKALPQSPARDDGLKIIELLGRIAVFIETETRKAGEASKATGAMVGVKFDISATQVQPETEVLPADTTALSAIPDAADTSVATSADPAASDGYAVDIPATTAIATPVVNVAPDSIDAINATIPGEGGLQPAAV